MADNLPLISIIIPAYNEENYLPSCLESISTLDYPPHLLEVLVIDNGSTDKTYEIAEGKGAVVMQDEEANVSGLRNIGAARAQGEILVFIDADCLVTSDMLVKASIYFGEMDIVAWGAPPNIPENATWVQRAWYLVRKKEKAVQDVEWLESMNLFVRREKFLKVDGFNEDLITCEDVDLCYRIKKYGRVVSDAKIQVVHLGEAATVREFFLKELWRGKSNFSGLLSHGFSFKELPSLLIPVYFGAFLPILFAGSAYYNTPMGFVAFLYCLPSILFLFKIRAKIETSQVPHLLLLLQVYFVSRTISVIK